MVSKPVSLRLSDPSDEYRTDEESANHQSNRGYVETIQGPNWNSEVEEFWLTIHQNDPRFASPYYHPQFTRSVAAVRDDVEIAVIRDSANQLNAVFPYQRLSSKVAAPIGGRMNDFHGIIGPKFEPVDVRKLLKDIEISQFGYHALSDGQTGFSDFNFETLQSFFVDLSMGIEDYMNWVRQNSSTVKRLPQKERSLARRFGQVTFAFESNDQIVLEKLIEFKRTKFQRTNTFDILSVDWASNLLHEISSQKTVDFRGVLSALKAGDQIVAAHFGMIANDVLHYWFPAYDTRFSKYSPGIQLMIHTCKAAAKSGIKKIDMSYGVSPFKDKFCNNADFVHTGFANFNPLIRTVAKGRYFTRLKLKGLPMKENFKVVLRKVFPSYGKWHFK